MFHDHTYEDEARLASCDERDSNEYYYTLGDDGIVYRESIGVSLCLSMTEPSAQL